MFGLFYPYGFVLQAIAILHFVRRRPDTLLALDHPDGRRRRAGLHLVEVIPDAACSAARSRCSRAVSASRSSKAAILDNPSIGNYEELGDLYLETSSSRGRANASTVIAKSDAIDPFIAARCARWRSTISRAAAADLEKVVARDPKYDYQRAAGLQAHALANSANGRAPTHCSRKCCKRRRCRRRSTTTPASCGHGPHRRSARVGRTHPAQEGDDAGLHPPPGAAVVPEAAALLKRLPRT